MKRQHNEKFALCPLCNEMHKVWSEYWLIPASTRYSHIDPRQIHEGVQTEVYCHVEKKCVVKQYSHEFKYIGYYIAEPTPF